MNFFYLNYESTYVSRAISLVAGCLESIATLLPRLSPTLCERYITDSNPFQSAAFPFKTRIRACHGFTEGTPSITTRRMYNDPRVLHLNTLEQEPSASNHAILV